MQEGPTTGSRSAIVAYGSETGAAQDVAEELGRLARRLRFATRVVELNSVGLVSSCHCNDTTFSAAGVAHICSIE